MQYDILQSVRSTHIDELHIYIVWSDIFTSVINTHSLKKVWRYLIMYVYDTRKKSNSVLVSTIGSNGATSSFRVRVKLSHSYSTYHKVLLR